jgi:hypothetical protein
LSRDWELFISSFVIRGIRVKMYSIDPEYQIFIGYIEGPNLYLKWSLGGDGPFPTDTHNLAIPSCFVPNSHDCELE